MIFEETQNSKMYLSLLMTLLCCSSFVSTLNSASTEWPPGFDPERQCIFACKETAQSTNILCSSEHLQGPIYTPPDTQHCSVYGRIVCQVSVLEFKSLEIDTADRCSQNVLDLTGVMIQSDSDNIKPCQSVLNGTSTNGGCLEMNIFVSLGCEQSNATVIPVNGWTHGHNAEHFCIYISSPQPRSQSDSMEPIATSEAVSPTLPLPACTNAAIEPTATISSTLSPLIGTEPTPSLVFDTSTSSSLTSLTSSISSTGCVCSNEETTSEETAAVVTSMSVMMASSTHAPGPYNIAMPLVITTTESDQDKATNDDFKLAVLIAVPVLGTVAIVATLGFFVLLFVVWLRKPCKSNNSLSTVTPNRGAY